MEVLWPGFATPAVSLTPLRRAEGKEKGKDVVARQGLEGGSGISRSKLLCSWPLNDASSAGGWKPNPKLPSDEQKPDIRRDASGASGHVTAKPSICGWGAFCQFGVHAAKVTCITPGDLPGASVDLGWALGNWR